MPHSASTPHRQHEGTVARDVGARLAIDPVFWKTDETNLLRAVPESSMSEYNVAWIPDLASEVMIHLANNYIAIQEPSTREFKVMDTLVTKHGAWDAHYSVVAWRQDIQLPEDPRAFHTALILDRVAYINGKPYIMQNVDAHTQLIAGLNENIEVKPENVRLGFVQRTHAVNARGFWNHMQPPTVVPAPKGLRFEHIDSITRAKDRVWFPKATTPTESVDEDTLFTACETQTVIHS